VTRRPPDRTDVRVPCPGASRVFYRVALGEPGRRAKLHPRGSRVEAVRRNVPSSN